MISKALCILCIWYILAIKRLNRASVVLDCLEIRKFQYFSYLVVIRVRVLTINFV